MRGKPHHSQDVETVQRLIPAYAGKTIYDATARLFTGAHPRVCGENYELGRRQHRLAGSSPRMRGKHGPRPSRRRGRRLIPAYAGKTRGLADDAHARRAHPRVCGENPREAQWIEAQQGSSPRMRGKLTTLASSGLSSGLIPAYAGKTSLI